VRPAALLALTASLAVAPALAPVPASAEETLASTIAADVLRVIDGDTMAWGWSGRPSQPRTVVRAHLWLGQTLEVTVRVAGVDTPEPRRPQCARERALADRATAFTRVWTEMCGQRVELRAVQRGTWAGRVVAEVYCQAGGDLGGQLLFAQLARPYDGGRRGSWCE